VHALLAAPAPVNLSFVKDGACKYSVFFILEIPR